MRPRLDPDLRAQLEGDPDHEVHAILVAAASIDELIASLPGDVVVRHKYRLIKAVAVSAPAAAVRRLAELSTVQSIEPVRAVQSW